MSLYDALTIDGRVALFTADALGLLVTLSFLFMAIAYRAGRPWFLAGGLVALLAFCSPLGPMADAIFFSAHMAQHVVLLLIVPLLAVLGWAAVRRQGGAKSASESKLPIWASWLAGVGVMWFWHQRTICSASFVYPAVAWMRDISFIGAGILFWLPVFGANRRRVEGPAAVGYLFSACIACTALAAYITFSPTSICPAFLGVGASGGALLFLRQSGFSSMDDQMLAGLIMWVPSCMIFVAASMVALHRWFGVEVRRPHAPGDSDPAVTA